MPLYRPLAECELLSDAPIVTPEAKPLEYRRFAIGQAVDEFKSTDNLLRSAAQHELIQLSEQACLGRGGLWQRAVASDVIGHHLPQKGLSRLQPLPLAVL